MMKVIGIIGGIGAGKTTIVQILETLKTTFVISADNIGHHILLKDGRAYAPVVEHFGEGILDESGQIIRRELGKLVFNSEKQLQVLNHITHPIIYDEVEKGIKKCKEECLWELVVIDAALLIEIGLVKLTDKVIGVYADEPTRIKRMVLRDGFTLQEAKARIKAQKSWEQLKIICDEIIDNTDSVEITKEQIKIIVENW